MGNNLEKSLVPQINEMVDLITGLGRYAARTNKFDLSKRIKERDFYASVTALTNLSIASGLLYLIF